jgi:hypothetical protein
MGPRLQTAASTGDGTIEIEWLDGFTLQFSPAGGSGPGYRGPVRPEDES